MFNRKIGIGKGSVETGDSERKKIGLGEYHGEVIER
jgi:hypothetical protein